MRLISFAIALISAALPWLPAAEQEVVTLSPEEDIAIELRAEVIEAEQRAFAPGICVWRDQLWQYTMTNPPVRILTSADIIINGVAVELDVSGLAMPWIAPEEMTEQDCHITKYCFGEDDRDTCYELAICFFKGGAEDYIVTWIIYEGCSQRIRIEDAGDVYPEWYMEEEAE